MSQATSGKELGDVKLEIAKEAERTKNADFEKKSFSAITEQRDVRAPCTTIAV